MRKLRVTAAMVKAANAVRGERGQARMGGVMHVPAILDVDSWEKQARVIQAALVASSYEDRRHEGGAPVVITHGDPEADARRQAEHAEAFRRERKQERAGGLDLVRAQEARAKRIVR